MMMKFPTSAPGPDGEAADQLRLLVEGVWDYATVMLDAEGNVTGWNPGAERIKGYSAEEIIGEHVSRFYTPDDIAAGLPGEVLRAAEADRAVYRAKATGQGRSALTSEAAEIG